MDEIPGVDATLDEAIIAELGADLPVFENASQLASWREFVRATTNRLESAEIVAFPRAMSI